MNLLTASGPFCDVVHVTSNLTDKPRADASWLQPQTTRYLCALADPDGRGQPVLLPIPWRMWIGAAHAAGAVR